MTESGKPGEIFFPEGIIGFEDCKRYDIVEEESNQPFFWLQSLDNKELGFIILNPKEFKKDYRVELSGSDKRVLKVQDGDECSVFSIVLVPDDSERMSANLLAPVIINKKDKIGRQVVLQDSGYSVRHLIMDEMDEGVKEKDVSSFAQAR